MVNSFELNSKKYDYRINDLSDDGLYVLDTELNGYVAVPDVDITVGLQSKIDEANATITSTQYQRDRQYSTWQEQMDQQYWDQVNGTTTWKDAIAKVKSDNPKE